MRRLRPERYDENPLYPTRNQIGTDGLSGAEDFMTTKPLAHLRRTPGYRLAVSAVTFTSVILAFLIVPPWIRVFLPDERVRGVQRALLVAAQPAYCAMVPALLMAFLILGWMVSRARKRGAS